MIIIKALFWICLFLIVYSYILYPLILLLIDRGQRLQVKRSDHLPNVSVIIAAYNEEKMIESRIKNCLALDYPADKLEIIIASDGSTDKTIEIAQKYSDPRIVL